MPIVVNSLDSDSKPLVITQGSAFNLDYTLTKDGATYNLTGKTVVCTIRAEGAPQTVLDTTPASAFEDRTITVGGGTVSAANGGCYNAVSAVESAELGPTGTSVSVDEITWYIVQTKVSTDSYLATEVLRFGIRKGID
jgi:hypothetical protein